MKQSLALAGLLGLLLVPTAVLAHGRGGHSMAPSSSYHPQPSTFQNHPQPKFVNPSGIAPSINHFKAVNQTNKLINPKLHLGSGNPIGGTKLGTGSAYAFKGTKVLSGKYCCYHGCFPNCWWFGSYCCWPCWCDFSYPVFPWMAQMPIALVPPPIPGAGGPVSPVGPNEELLPTPMPVQPPVQPTAATSPAERQPTAPAGPMQVERFLKVKNDTKEKVRFFALFHTKGTDGKAAWVPAQPGEPATVYSVEVEAGKSLELTDDDGKPIAADRVRIWAASATRQWLDNETADLVLVPETGAAGNHEYAAADNQVHTFTVTD